MNEWSLAQKALVSLILASAFVLFLILESVFPLRRRKRGLLGRAAVNVFLSAMAFLVGGLVVRVTALSLAYWTAEQPFGLLHLIKMPFGVQFAFGFLLMDLTFYHWHLANHAVPVLWRFHNVHHVDPDLDVTTSFRFHAVEVLYSTVFRAVQVTVLGISPLTYVVYEIFFQIATMFHHSNSRLPIRFERWLNKIVVTPRMHGVHHSDIKGETNSNYSVIFRWWDALHRSLRLNVPQSQIDIGVAGYREPQDNNLWSLIVLPFRKQRYYWPQSVQRPPAEGVTLPTRLSLMLE